MTQSGFPAGWYQDPMSSGALRWWDGQRWTEHYRPAAAAPYQGAPSFHTTMGGYGPVPPKGAVTSGFGVKRVAAIIALVLLVPTVGFFVAGMFTGGGEKNADYQQGYQIGLDDAVGMVRTLGGSAEDACRMHVTTEVGIADSNSRRAKDMRRGCVQAVRDELTGS